jgi:trk system potassium uptake protein TrkH
VTAACALAYWLAGMNLFDAICHAFSTLSSGGFGDYDASMAHFNSSAIDAIAIVFMLVAGANFALHYLAWHRGSARVYLHDTEFKVYLTWIMFLVLLVSGTLYLRGTYPDLGSALRYGAFQLVSLATCTGFTTTDFTVWPGALPVLLVLSSAFCAMAGSTSGGIKMIRLILLVKYGYREILRIIHPSAEIPVKVGGRAVSSQVLAAVSGFFAVYVILFLIFWFVLMGLGLPPLTALSAVSLSINNMGPGLGEVASNFATVGPAVKWVCIFAMLVGRLELFTLLAVLTPAFWRR